MSDEAAMDRLRAGVHACVRERNAELTRDGVISIAIGATSTVVVALLILWLTYIFWPLLDSFDLTGLGRGEAALLVTALMLGSGIWNGWRRHSALEDLSSIDDGDFVALVLRSTSPRAEWGEGRLALAGFADLVIGGPRQFFDGVADLRRRIPADPMSIGLAAALLAQAMSREQIDIATVPGNRPNRAALLALRRLSLVVPSQSRPTGRHLMATRKAEAMRANISTGGGS